MLLPTLGSLSHLGLLESTALGEAKLFRARSPGALTSLLLCRVGKGISTAGLPSLLGWPTPLLLVL